MVYPQGINSHWNDGRANEKFNYQDQEIDDVAFVIDLLNELKSVYNIDKNKIYAVGMSNGGIFCQRLAAEQSQYFTAVASVAAQMAMPISRSFSPQVPISVLIMNGTEDFIVPYSGGEVKYITCFPSLSIFRKRPSKGNVISTDATIHLWLEHNQIYTSQTIEKIPDLDKDKVTVEINEWRSSQKGVSVVLYKIIRGGHTLPGGQQYLPENKIGKTCMDIEASEIIWEFFRNKHRTN